MPSCYCNKIIDFKETKIRPEHTHYVAKFGETIILPCRIENLKQSTVIWQYSKNRLPETLTVGFVQYRTDYRVRLITNVTSEEYQKWDLEIRKIKLEDEGNYVCRVTNNGITLKRLIHLKVEVKMTIDPVNPVVYYKESISLFCNTSYMENESIRQKSINYEIEWYKNSELNRINFPQNMNASTFKIENSYSPTFSSQLTIIHVRPSNIGTYICKFRSQNVSTTLKKSNSKYIKF